MNKNKEGNGREKVQRKKRNKERANMITEAKDGWMRGLLQKRKKK